MKKEKAKSKNKVKIRKSMKIKKFSGSQKSKFKISKTMTFGEVLHKNPEIGYKLAERGLFCGGCAMAQFETIEQGARAHGLNPDDLVRELNGEKKKSKVKKKIKKIKRRKK